MNIKSKSNLWFKTTMLFLAILVVSASASAQGFYGSINAGYGFPLGSQQVLGLSNTIYNSNTDYYSDEPVFMSFAEGMYVGASGGYMFNEHVGVDLGVNYLFGNSQQGTYQSSYSDPDFQYNGSDVTILSANMLRVTPSLVVRTGMENLNPYARLGVVFGFATVNMEQTSKFTETYNGTTTQENTEMTYELNEGVAIGLSSALGVLFTVSEKMSFFAEVAMTNMSYAPNKGMVTKYTENGVDLLNTLTTAEKEVEFVDKVVEEGNAPSNPNKPSQVARIFMPFGSYGLNIGVVFSF